MKKLFAFAFMICFCQFASAQKFPIPTIDWSELKKTEPWKKTEDWSTNPRHVAPGYVNSLPPDDAIVLFDGYNFSQWHKPQYTFGADFNTTLAHVKNKIHEDFPGTEAEWDIVNGAMQVRPGGGNIETKRSFGSVQLHIEWMSPLDPEKEGQMYSNSGVFLMGLYEIQVLNSFDNQTYANGQAGSVYKQTPPLVNASKPPGEWQTYDIIFTAPTFEDGNLNTPAFVTVLHNGILIQNNFELEGPTFYIGTSTYFEHPDKLPIILQDHGDKVKFRNIWVREL